MTKIKISIKWLNKKFRCDENFIKTICGGRCCRSKNKMLICLLPKETIKLQKQFPSCKIKNNKIIGKDNICFFKDENELCKLHNTKYKPLGCIFSPFKINKNNTLIIRHRYIRLPCFNKEDGFPAYITFSNSLIRVFGENTYNIIKKKMEKNSDDFYIDIDNDILEELNFLEDIKHG